jgi:hypothetical protein
MRWLPNIPPLIPTALLGPALREQALRALLGTPARPLAHRPARITYLSSEHNGRRGDEGGNHA